MAMPPGTREKRGMSYGKSPGNPTTTPGPRRAVLRVYNSGTSPWACSYGCSMPPSLRSRGPRLGRAPGYGRGISGPGTGCTQVEQCCPFTTREENAMLHLDYIGLLNTDHRRKGPVQMFLQGRESHTRYVLDTLPSWVADMLGHTPESTGERRSIALWSRAATKSVRSARGPSIGRSVRSLCPEPHRRRRAVMWSAHVAHTQTAHEEHGASLP